MHLPACGVHLHLFPKLRLPTFFATLGVHVHPVQTWLRLWNEASCILIDQRPVTDACQFAGCWCSNCDALPRSDDRSQDSAPSSVDRWEWEWQQHAAELIITASLLDNRQTNGTDRLPVEFRDDLYSWRHGYFPFMIYIMLHANLSWILSRLFCTA